MYVTIKLKTFEKQRPLKERSVILYRYGIGKFVRLTRYKGILVWMNSTETLLPIKSDIWGYLPDLSGNYEASNED